MLISEIDVLKYYKIYRALALRFYNAFIVFKKLWFVSKKKICSNICFLNNFEHVVNCSGKTCVDVGKISIIHTHTHTYLRRIPLTD